MQVIRIVPPSDQNCTYRGTFLIKCMEFSHFLNNYNIKHFHIKKILYTQSSYTEHVSALTVYLVHVFYTLKHVLSEMIEIVLSYCILNLGPKCYSTLRKPITKTRTKQWLHMFETTTSTHFWVLNLERRSCHFCLTVLISAILVLSMLVNKKNEGEVTMAYNSH
jgi:hypothetical protein